jgi:hypothetical protein
MLLGLGSVLMVLPQRTSCTEVKSGVHPVSIRTGWPQPSSGIVYHKMAEIKHCLQRQRTAAASTADGKKKPKNRIESAVEMDLVLLGRDS